MESIIIGLEHVHTHKYTNIYYILCLVVDNPDCAYGDLRLVGGASDLEGRLEVCIGGRWGTVCDDQWDTFDAAVVCSQLGFPREGATARTGAFFGQGTGPIFFDETRCSGNESKLVDCPSSAVGVHNCLHAEDAAVICQRKTTHLLLIFLQTCEFFHTHKKEIVQFAYNYESL